MNARVVSQSGFGGAANSSVFEVGVQEGSTQPALAKASPRSVAKSFLYVGDEIVRCQHTSRTRVLVVQPFVRDMRVTQVFDPRHLLPSTLEVECVLQTPQSSSVRQP